MNMDFGVFAFKPLKLKKFPIQERNFLKDSFPPVPCWFMLVKPLPVITKHEELNIFKQIGCSETSHSKILADLLNPQGEHGQKTVFLAHFFTVFKIDADINDTWIVSAEKERYDIRIMNQSKTKIIIIENKSNWAEDQQNQLYRYWYNGIHVPQLILKNMGYVKLSKIIYLSPNDYKSPSEQTLSRPVEWDDSLPDKVPMPIDVFFFSVEIVKWLDLCMDSVSAHSSIYYYLKQYRDFWRS